MISKERLEELKPLLEDENFGVELKDAVTISDITKAFAAHGVAITETELSEIASQIPKEQFGELSETSLDNVAGGGLTGALIIGGGCLVAWGVGWVISRVARDNSGYCR